MPINLYSSHKLKNIHRWYSKEIVKCSVCKQDIKTTGERRICYTNKGKEEDYYCIRCKDKKIPKIYDNYLLTRYVVVQELPLSEEMLEIEGDNSNLGIENISGESVFK